MEYKFVRTVAGPVVEGEYEVLLFSQFGPLQDYVDADPEFLQKAKVFISDSIVELAEQMAASLHVPVVGHDYYMSLPMYSSAIQHITNFENYLRQQVR
jgi:hypothetical protein